MQLVLLLFLFDFSSLMAQKVEIRGIYGNPKPFWDQEISLRELGVNAVFVHSGAIDQQMIAQVRSEGLMIFAEFATLNGKNYVEDHPEAWAVNDKGHRVEAATWFMGVCPTEPGFRKYRMTQLQKLLDAYDLDGVWMDYVHWHAQFEDPQPILPETCFNDYCLEKFSRDTGVVIPRGTTEQKAHFILSNHNDTWRHWRCQVIIEWAREFKEVLRQKKPEALLGLFHCPWQDDEFDHAIRRVLGLDFDRLAEVIDVFSPMVYHGRMERSSQWVADNVAWYGQRLSVSGDAEPRPRLWPIVQAYNDPHIISSEEFRTVLKGGLSGGASGVMMFTSYAVAEDPKKVAVMKEVYRGLAAE